MNAERAKELKHSMLWKELCDVLKDDIEKAKEQLVVADETRVPYLQHRIKVLRDVMNKPDTIIDQSAG